MGLDQYAYVAAKAGQREEFYETSEYNEETKDFALEPKHDWASHIGDAFSYGALVMRLRIIEEKKPEPHQNPFATSLTLDQLWAETPKFQNARI